MSGAWGIDKANVQRAALVDKPEMGADTIAFLTAGRRD